MKLCGFKIRQACTHKGFPKDRTNGRAYNPTPHLTERRRMMQTWADYLDGLKAGAKVIPLRRNAENVAAVS